MQEGCAQSSHASEPLPGDLGFVVGVLCLDAPSRHSTQCISLPPLSYATVWQLNLSPASLIGHDPNKEGSFRASTKENWLISKERGGGAYLMFLLAVERSLCTGSKVLLYMFWVLITCFAKRWKADCLLDLPKIVVPLSLLDPATMQLHPTSFFNWKEWNRTW